MEIIVEFFNLDGQVFYRKNNGEAKLLTQSDREAVCFMLENMRRYFPEAVYRLEEWAAESRANRMFYEFRIVDRFIRCNFGEADNLTPDVDRGVFHFEEVKCPLRKICRDEGVICKPKLNSELSAEERKVVKLYAKGYLPGEIAEELGKAEKTCKQQIWSACRRLKLPHPRWLIRIFNSYTL